MNYIYDQNPCKPLFYDSSEYLPNTSRRILLALDDNWIGFGYFEDGKFQMEDKVYGWEQDYEKGFEPAWGIQWADIVL